MGSSDSEDRLFLTWLEQTRELQIGSFGVDPATLEGEDRAAYVMWNMLAAHDELSEALQEIVWKPWVNDGHGEMNHSRFATELVDVMHFVANMLLVAGYDDEQLNGIYLQKMERNRERQREGYSGVKCPECGREIETMHKITTMGQDTYICVCGTNLRLS